MSTHPLADAKDFALSPVRVLTLQSGLAMGRPLSGVGASVSRENPLPTPLFDAAISQADIRLKTEKALELSYAVLEKLWEGLPAGLQLIGGKSLTLSEILVAKMAAEEILL